MIEKYYKNKLRKATQSNSKQLKATQSNSQATQSNSKQLSSNSKQKMSSTTFAMRVKEIMVNMPDNLDTKKEIDEYYKNAMKDIKEKNKEEKKEKKEKKAAIPKKRAKKVEVDDDGNEIEKVKRPLNSYQKFIQDNRTKVKEENPTLNGEEIFKLIADLWNEHKKSMKKEEDKKDSDDNKDSDEEDKKDSDDDDDKKEDKKAPKGGKAPRKALGVKAAPKKKKESS